MNILLTGASGFVGSRILSMANELISEEDNLYCLTSKPIKGFICVLNSKDHHYTRNHFFESGIDHIDVVIHLGHSLKRDSRGMYIPSENFDSVCSTMHLLNALPNIPHNFVFCSTMDVYGIHRKDAVNEESEPYAANAYAVSKIFSEMLIKEWANERRGGVNLQILRLAHIYGPEDKRMYSIPIWLKAKAHNQHIKLYTNPSMYRNCLYIDDCCRGIVRAAYLERSEGVINLVSEHNATMLEIANLCKEISHNPYEIDMRPNNNDAEMGLRIDNNEKCRKLLGREQVTLREGLERELNYLEKFVGDSK